MTSKQPPSDWELQRYHFGFLNEKETHRIEQHISHDKHAQQQLTALRKDQQLPVFSLERAQTRWAHESTNEQASQQPQKTTSDHTSYFASWLKPSTWNSLLFGGFATACALLIILPSIWIWQTWNPPQRLIGVQIKGQKDAVQWSVYVNGAKTQSVRVRPGQTLHPDDRIRFHVTLKKPACLMIVSVEEKGAVNLYWPYPQRQAVCLQAGTHALPRDSSIQLDETLGWERFVIRTCTKTFPFKSLQHTLRTRLKRVHNDIRQLKALKDHCNERHLQLQKRP